MAIYVYDPTVKDTLSKVRGIGRYMQILQQALPEDTIFTDSIAELPAAATLLNPFFDFIKPPLFIGEKTKKQIAVIHDIIRLRYPKHFPLGIKGKFNVQLNKFALKYYDTIITDSEHSKKTLIDFLQISSSKISVVYPILSNVLTKNTTQEVTPPEIKQPYCVYVGDITWNKNLITLAQAIKKTKLRCVCIGKAFGDRRNLDHPEKRDFRRFLELTEGDERFIFPGYVSDEQLIAYYKHAVCNILVSYDEGFGFSYLEAAQCGTPSVLSDIDVFKETAQDSALFADPHDQDDIARQLKKMVNDQQLRSDLGIAAKKRAAWFSQKQFKKTLIEALEA